jgi:HK97 family phage major capsid protein
MLEVKANALEESFDAILQADRMTGIEARMDAFDAALRRQAERAGRPPLDGAKGGEVDPARAAFADRYLRRGIEVGVELKSFSGATSGAGGYAVPREIDEMIGATLKAISPLRSVANVVRTGSAGYRKLVTTGGVVSGWAAETGARAETATPTFQEIAPPSGELFANPSASQAMLDDAQFDVEGWLAGEIAREFARAEGAAFINGDGSNKPKGFLTYTATNQADSA